MDAAGWDSAFGNYSNSTRWPQPKCAEEMQGGGDGGGGGGDGLVDNWTGVPLAVSGWSAAGALVLLGLIILVTIVGNVLVILSVFTHKPLRIVQNFFIVSLAVADLTVAVLVLPLNVAYSLLGRWVFGRHACTMWLTSDVMCCTASILNLCAIALDRYWAITEPIAYAQKRTMRRVMVMIALVWLLSALICSPPLVGWNDWPDVFTNDTPCMLTSQKGYVIYSSLGSFYIPLLVMTIVYAEIFVATRRRLRERRAKAPRVAKNSCAVALNEEGGGGPAADRESVSSETNHNERPGGQEKRKKRGKKKKAAAAAEEGVVVEERGAQQQVYQFVEERQKISLSKERRAARTLGIIMGVFVICWLPFFLMYVIVPFCDSCCPSGLFVNVITWLGYINSALNPIIYTIFNLDFRKAFKKLLRIKDTT